MSGNIFLFPERSLKQMLPQPLTLSLAKRPALNLGAQQGSRVSPGRLRIREDALRGWSARTIGVAAVPIGHRTGA